MLRGVKSSSHALPLLELLGDEDSMSAVPLLDTPQKGASRAAAAALDSDGYSPMDVSPGDDASREIRSPPSVGDDAPMRKPLTTRWEMDAYEEDDGKTDENDGDDEAAPT